MLLIVHAKPDAHETKAINWLDEQTIVIALHATPSDGEANEELVDFLAKKLKLPKTFINIKSGLSSRVKRVELPDGTALGGLRP